MRRDGNIVRYTANEIDERIASGEARFDRARIEAMTEEELEASIDEEDEWRPEDWQPVAVAMGEIDPRIVSWFVIHGGPGYAERINDVLRAYIASQGVVATAAD